MINWQKGIEQLRYDKRLRFAKAWLQQYCLPWIALRSCVFKRLLIEGNACVLPVCLWWRRLEIPSWTAAAGEGAIIFVSGNFHLRKGSGRQAAEKAVSAKSLLKRGRAENRFFLNRKGKCADSGVSLLAEPVWVI